jgi:hypothetical protein
MALNSLMSQFEKHCQADESLKSIFEKNSSQRMAFAQHNGLPTELLDWTESPYIAAFFAVFDFVKSKQTKPEVCIWIIDTFNPLWLAGSPEAKLKPPFTVAGWKNSRLRNQRGWFTTVEPKFTSFEEVLAEIDGGTDLLSKCTISVANSADSILVDLQLMGISPASLFPDPTGWASSALLDTMLRVSQVDRMAHVYPWENDS